MHYNPFDPLGSATAVDPTTDMERRVRAYQMEGFTELERTSGSVRLVKPKRFSWIRCLLLLGIFYLPRYLFSSDEYVYMSVGDELYVEEDRGGEGFVKFSILFVLLPNAPVVSLLVLAAYTLGWRGLATGLVLLAYLVVRLWTSYRSTFLGLGRIPKLPARRPRGFDDYDPAFSRDLNPRRQLIEAVADYEARGFQVYRYLPEAVHMARREHQRPRGNDWWGVPDFFRSPEDLVVHSIAGGWLETKHRRSLRGLRIGPDIVAGAVFLGLLYAIEPALVLG